MTTFPDNLHTFDDDMLAAASEQIAADLLAHATEHGLDLEALLPSEQEEYAQAQSIASQYMQDAFHTTLHTVPDLVAQRLRTRGGSARAAEAAVLLRLRALVHGGERVGDGMAHDHRTATLKIGPKELRNAILYVADYRSAAAPSAVAVVVAYLPPGGDVKDGGASHPGFVNDRTGEIVAPYTDEGKSVRNGKPSPLLRNYRMVRLLTEDQREGYELGMEAAQDALWTMDRLARRASLRGTVDPEAEDDPTSWD